MKVKPAMKEQMEVREFKSVTMQSRSFCKTSSLLCARADCTAFWSERNILRQCRSSLQVVPWYSIMHACQKGGVCSRNWGEISLVCESTTACENCVTRATKIIISQYLLKLPTLM